MKPLARLLLLALAPLLAFRPPDPEKITVWLIGDSTMCPYPPSRAPLTGWGMPFSAFFDESVTINNRARGGRSTRTFIAENRWKPIADSLHAGDYVFMQFGHNDEAKEEIYKDRYTSPQDYRRNLVRFIDDTRAKNAFPVVVTPVSRKKFDQDGRAAETHADYSAVAISVADSCRVPLIDLDARSLELIDTLGPANAKLLFNDLDPGVNPHYPDGIHDNTHFNDFGARRIAELVLAEMRRVNLPLIQHVLKRPAN